MKYAVHTIKGMRGSHWEKDPDGKVREFPIRDEAGRWIAENGRTQTHLVREYFGK
jgi:hypothetical protein